MVQRQKHKGYTELLLSSQTFKQVNVPGETVDSLGQTAASQGFQEHNHPSGAASHNFNVLLLSTDILCYFSGHVKLLQKLLALQICALQSAQLHICTLFHILHCQGKPSRRSSAQNYLPLYIWILKATALRDMNRNYPPQMAVGVNNCEC